MHWATATLMLTTNTILKSWHPNKHPKRVVCEFDRTSVTFEQSVDRTLLQFDGTLVTCGPAGMHPPSESSTVTISPHSYGAGRCDTRFFSSYGCPAPVQVCWEDQSCHHLCMGRQPYRVQDLSDEKEKICRHQLQKPGVQFWPVVSFLKISWNNLGIVDPINAIFLESIILRVTKPMFWQ